ncbi:MAG: DUF2087 domain-containing protein [Calditrichaeota bacterium]|jgi:hypothetical protein|nr:DUF2087 domain-containing protein [Calditrichota bacterium]
MEIPKAIRGFFDGDKIKQWPGKLAKKTLCLEYLAEKIEAGKEFSDTEIKEAINEWITFGDPVTVRRELIEAKVLDRSPDGRTYWKVEKDG